MHQEKTNSNKVFNSLLQKHIN